MKQYRAPNGQRIIGTADLVMATAIIKGFDDTGDVVHMGESEVDWDSQKTRTRNGKPLYVCENGEEWTLDQCVSEDDAD